MLRMNFPERKAARRERVADLAAARAKRSPQDQLARLDAGGFAATKERKRLQRQIAKAT